MSLFRHCHVSVSHMSDASEARRLARTIALELGFDVRESEDLALVASELATNLVKHAQSGQLIFTSIEDDGRTGIKFQSQDNGPGISDVDQVITDGFSSTDSLGYGLGTINRLMDDFDIRPRPDGKNGTLITCRRWKRSHIRKHIPGPLSIGIATRSRPNMSLNGDAFVAEQWNKSVLIAVIDGLGHGQHANVAAQAAREYIEEHYDQPLSMLFRGAGRACRATRGVVMALARFDWDRNPIKMSFAGIGNIEIKVFGCPNPMKFLVQRGVVGLNAPEPIVAEYDWASSYVLVLHSDGLNSKWQWSDYPELDKASANETARLLLQGLARNDDDATVIVVRKSVSSVVASHDG
ncbi:MAG TPA: ATP-binding SpoIIE family protein phosphatase [Syntrophomonadaceae bacterium]|nr:ATP-binding SpoIIE family protein phosphatase [Syntrophomonadaceae bacterium]